MKKILVVTTALCLVLSSLLTACGSDSKQAEQSATTQTQEQVDSSKQAEATPSSSNIKGKIIFASNRTDMDDKFKIITNEFAAKYPEAEVEIQPVMDYTKTLKIRLASNDAPDVMYMDGSITPKAELYPNFYAPIDDMGYSKDTIAFFGSNSYEGKTYTLCEGVYVTGVLCSKKTLTDAGIQGYPKTLDELMAAAEKLKAKGVTPFGSMVKTKWPLGSWQTVVFANETGTSTDYYNNLTASDAPFTKDSSIGKMLNFVKMIKDKGYFDKDPISSDWDILRVDMSKTGFLMLANYGLGALDGTKPEDVGFFPLPIDNSGKTYSMMTSGWNMAIGKDSKNIETAKAFVKFWLDESKFHDYAGIIPSVKTKTSGVKQIADFMSANPVIVEVGNPTEDFNSITSKAQIDAGLTDMTQEVMLSRDIEQVLGKYNKKWAEARKSLNK